MSVLTTRVSARIAAAVIATATAVSLVPATAQAAPFVVRNPHPTLQDWTNQMNYLLSPNVTDAGIALNLEAGNAGVAAVKFFRFTARQNPNWKWSFVGPAATNGAVSTAYFVQSAPGYPTVKKPSKWKKINGNWRISNETLCHYVNVHRVGKTTFCK